MLRDSRPHREQDGLGPRIDRSAPPSWQPAPDSRPTSRDIPRRNPAGSISHAVVGRAPYARQAGFPDRAQRADDAWRLMRERTNQRAQGESHLHGGRANLRGLPSREELLVQCGNRRRIISRPRRRHGQHAGNLERAHGELEDVRDRNANKEPSSVTTALIDGGLQPLRVAVAADGQSLTAQTAIAVTSAMDLIATGTRESWAGSTAAGCRAHDGCPYAPPSGSKGARTAVTSEAESLDHLLEDMIVEKSQTVPPSPEPRHDDCRDGRPPSTIATGIIAASLEKRLIRRNDHAPPGHLRVRTRSPPRSSRPRSTTRAACSPLSSRNSKRLLLRASKLKWTVSDCAVIGVRTRIALCHRQARRRLTGRAARRPPAPRRSRCRLRCSVARHCGSCRTF